MFDPNKPDSNPEENSFQAQQQPAQPQGTQQTSQPQPQPQPQLRGPQIPLANLAALGRGPFYQQQPRPMGFWSLLLKDILATAFGIGFFCLLLFFLFAAGLVALVQSLDGVASSDSLPAIEETVISGDDDCKGKIVVLPIEGVIETDETGFLPTALDAIREDSRVKGVVLRVNSPGGTISGSDFDLHLLKKLKAELDIPFVVSMGDMAASGGYYISMVGDKIFAERSTVTGSIGVIVRMYNAAELCKKIGVRSDPIASGAMKNMGDFMKEPTPEETAIWQKTVDDSYEQFLSVVREGRPWFRGEESTVAPKPRKENIGGVDVIVEKVEQKVAQTEEPVESEAAAPEEAEVLEENAETPEQAGAVAEEAGAKEESEQGEKNETSESLVAERDAALRKLADGRIYSAAEAKDLHLIDEIGFLDDAIDAAIELAGLDKKSAEVVRYSETKGVLDSLFSVQGKTRPVEKAMESMSAPRGYYLAPRAVPFND